MRNLLAAVWTVCAATLAATVAQAQDNPVVIELYTSQGCSSCPPADELMRELAKMDDVIPLALHVDYWDYIGWKDSFASPAFTKRQRSYARAAGHRTIYTPQMIVGGVDNVVGYKPMKLAALIQAHREKPRHDGLKIVRTGDTLSIACSPFGQTATPMVVQLIRYVPEETVEIGRGENAGKTITYANIVTEWTNLGPWDGTGPLDLNVAATGTDPLVVVLQRSGHQEILAAARLR